MFKKVAFLAAVVLMLVIILPAAPVSAQEPYEEWFAAAGEPYKGVTIKGVSESTEPSKFMQRTLAPIFEELTGIKVEFEVTSWDEMYNKEIKDMEAGTGVYDFVYVEQDIVFAYLDREFLTNLTALMGEKPELLYPDLDMGDFTSFIDDFEDAEGNVFGLPFEAFLKVYLYRKDLFEDPAIQAAFKEKYGWDLRAAVNFDEYAQIAEFFAEWGKDKELWGTTVQAHSSHAASFYEVVETIWPSWGVYNWGINMENWKATSANGGTMDSDRAKQALAFWIGMLKYAPPESRVSTWDEVGATFAGGRAAQGWVYGENAAWIATDPERSTVVGKVGVAFPPLYPGVINEAAKGQGYIGYYDGGALGIPWCSNNKEAALLFLQWVTLKEFQGDFAAKAARVVRTSTFLDPLVLEVDPKVDHYYTLFRNTGNLFKGAPAFAFHAPVREVMAPYVWKAIAGELTPEDACDQMAVAVDEELARLGYQ